MNNSHKKVSHCTKKNKGKKYIQNLKTPPLPSREEHEENIFFLLLYRHGKKEYIKIFKHPSPTPENNENKLFFLLLNKDRRKRIYNTSLAAAGGTR